MWPALAIIAASAFAQHFANKKASQRQEGFRRSMEAYQREKAHETEAAAEDLITKQTPKARGDELAEVTAGREKSLRDTVGAAQAFDAPPIAGKLSADYGAAEGAEADRRAERTRRAIEQLATTGAPTEQQQRFGIRFGRSAGTVDAANRASENVGRGYLSDIDTVRPNALLGMLSQIGLGVGGGMATGAMAGSGGSAANGHSYQDTSGSLHGDNLTRQQRLNRGFSLWGAR